MLRFLDILFTFLHLAIIVFNLTGWMWKKTRKAHLVVLGLTVGSWFVLGIWYGWGYCPLTDWQWNVKTQIGERGLPASFVKYFADKISGRNINSSLVDTVTLGCLVFAVCAAAYVNFIRKKNVKA